MDMERIFINYTNHPAAKWSEAERRAAEAFGRIVDLPFPNIPPEWDESAVAELAASEAEKIFAMEPVAVLIQGEFTFSYALIERLKTARVVCIAATSERVVHETTDDAGHTVRTSTFRFVRFRAY